MLYASTYQTLLIELIASSEVKGKQVNLYQTALVLDAFPSYIGFSLFTSLVLE